MFWICAKDEWWVYCTRDVEYGAGRQEEKRRLQRRFNRRMKEDMERFDVTEQDATESVRWRHMICWDKP